MMTSELHAMPKTQHMLMITCARPASIAVNAMSRCAELGGMACLLIEFQCLLIDGLT